MGASDWVGTSVPRLDARDKVTGHAKYTSDLRLPGMCYAALVRSSVPHGRIRRIDTAAAVECPGVVCVVVGAELAELGVLDPYFGLAVRDQPVLTDELIRYAGEPIAAVVARTPAEAERAALLVEVDVEVRPSTLTIEDALRTSVRVHPGRDSADPGRHNVAAKYEYSGGDVARAISEASYVHEATYRFPMVSHVAMEPHCSIASWTLAGQLRLEVMSSTQQPFKVRADLARMFGLPLTAVSVRAGYVGGGFGGKLLSKYEPLVAVLARKARQPVCLQLGAEESFQTIARHGAVVHMTTAVDNVGNITARDTQVFFDTGAYADKGPGVAKKAAYRAKGPYQIPNFRSAAYAVYTNKVPAGAFRGYSTPQVAWAGESAINEIAEHLAEDPLALRLRALTPRGDEFMPGDTPMDADLAEGIQLAATRLGWNDPLPSGHGRGLATGVKDGGGGPSRAEAEVRMLPDGSVEVLTGTAEIGQGALTVFAQIAAQELRCDLDVVHSVLPDTAVSPFDHGTEASRSTVLVGQAVRKAAIEVRDELTAVIASSYGAGAEFTLDGEWIRLATGEAALLADLLAVHRGLPPSVMAPNGQRGPVREFELAPIIGHGYHNTFQGDVAPLGTPSNFYEVGHGAVELTLDPETGEIELVRYVSVADVGKALNPRTCTGQDDGSALMGIGHTLFEELIFDGGHLLTSTLDAYALPRFRDLPRYGLHSLLLENEDGPGPYGAKGGGESGIIAVSPAVADALYAVCGVRFRELPLTPERVWRAIRDRSEKAPAATRARTSWRAPAQEPGQD